MFDAIVGVGLAAYGGIVGGLYVCQRRLLYHPCTMRPVLGDLAADGVDAVEITTADGLGLLAWYRPPSPQRPVILYLHGNGGHIGYRAERLRRLAREGYGVLLAEYRGFGGNPGQPSERGLVIDAEAAAAFLASEGIAPARTVLWGESLGSGVAIHLAATRAVAAIVLEAPLSICPGGLVGARQIRLALAHRPDPCAAAGHARRSRPGGAGQSRPQAAGGGEGAQGRLVPAAGRP